MTTLPIAYPWSGRPTLAEIAARTTVLDFACERWSRAKAPAAISSGDRLPEANGARHARSKSGLPLHSPQFARVSINLVRILELGRRADRSLKAPAIPLLVIVVASLALVPQQPPGLPGAEMFVLGMIA